MRETLTPAARRTVDSCRRMASASIAPQAWCDFLIFALLEIESLAAAALQRLGVSSESLLAERHSRSALDQAAAHLQADVNVITDEISSHAASALELDDPLEFIQILDRAAMLARRDADATSISSAHLLVAVFETNDLLRNQLLGGGVNRDQLVAELNMETTTTGPALPVDFDLNLSDCEPASTMNASSPGNAVRTVQLSEMNGAWRIIDANLNRCREGLRVLEDFARFVRNDASLSIGLKNLRHDLVAAESLLVRRPVTGNAINTDHTDSGLLVHRDTERDVGKQVTAFGENRRQDLGDVVLANSRRVQEALRSLEEYGKLVAPDFAATVKQIRYQCYTLQQGLQAVAVSTSLPDRRIERIRRLNSSVLYVLITESTCRRPWQQVVEATLCGGADVLQLREKHLNDRELLRRARWMADACRSAGRLMIMNDRADIAVAANTDGVHTGQEEFTVADARRVLDAEQILGISTHSLAQATQALADGADYIGVGPTFPSTTKSFSEFPGLALVKEVSANVPFPVFAIGGIDAANVAEVLQAGGNRVAVTSTIVGAEEPESATRELKILLGKIG
ncbi:MAG TPA: thiamine phosphate synthase [Planctomycetaceae bacterium]|nr:thiamine phosphate synthase [Planctomycetaceae bacterium]